METPNLNRALRQIGSDNVAKSRLVLQRNGKIATMTTAAGVRYETEVFTNGAEVRLYAPASWKFIVDGRPPGAPMPPSIKTRKGRHLALWFDVKGIPERADFPVRLKIARDGIDPVDITSEVIDLVKDTNEEEVREALRQDFLAHVFQLFKKALS